MTRRPSHSSVVGRQGGMSLIELMVALALGLVVIAAVGAAYLSSKQSYRVNESLARIQENARYAFDIMTKDVRLTGDFGCAAGGSANSTLNDADKFAWDFTQGLRGYRANADGTWSPSLPASGAPHFGPSGPLPGRDIITVRGVTGGATRVLQQPGGGSADIKVIGNSGLQEDDIVLVSHCRATAAIFQITHVNTVDGFDNLGHNTAVGHSPGNATTDLGNDYVGAEIARVATRSYYVRNNVAGVPALYRRTGNGDAQELLEGVEDMRVLYGVDVDGDSILDSYRDAAWVEANGRWDNVVSLRVELLVRSPEDGIVAKPQTYTFNGSTVVAGDRRLRQAFSTTITLRNRTL